MAAWDIEKSEQELFEENEYLIRHVIKTYFSENGAKVHKDDLYQEGSIALLNVIRKYKSGVRISRLGKYVVHSILKRCRQYLQYQSTTLHVSRRYQWDAIRDGKDAIDELIKKATAQLIDEIDAGSYDTYSTSDVEDSALLEIQIKEVLQTIERMPKNRQRILKSYFSNGMDINATAEECGCTTRTVYRARAFLREKVRYLKIFDKDDMG